MQEKRCAYEIEEPTRFRNDKISWKKTYQLSNRQLRYTSFFLFMALYTETDCGFSMTLLMAHSCYLKCIEINQTRHSLDIVLNLTGILLSCLSNY